MTPLLYSLFALFLLLAAFNSKFFAQIRYTRLIERRMDIAARMCEAAARDSFQIELDHTMESLTAFDQLLDTGWSSTRPMTEDTRYVIAAYFGDLFVRECGARWSAPRSGNGEPMLEFPKSRVKADPFAIIEYKVQLPDAVKLSTIGESLRALVEQRSKIDWSSSQEESITFAPQEEATSTIDANAP